ncbi:hypothetical protein SAMN03159382_06038, partial [Pseudomonas sp. NFACC23-1]
MTDDYVDYNAIALHQGVEPMGSFNSKSLYRSISQACPALNRGNTQRHIGNIEQGQR